MLACLILWFGAVGIDLFINPPGDYSVSFSSFPASLSEFCQKIFGADVRCSQLAEATLGYQVYNLIATLLTPRYCSLMAVGHHVSACIIAVGAIGGVFHQFIGVRCFLRVLHLNTRASSSLLDSQRSQVFLCTLWNSWKYSTKNQLILGAIDFHG